MGHIRVLICHVDDLASDQMTELVPLRLSGQIKSVARHFGACDTKRLPTPAQSLGSAATTRS